MKFQSLYRNHQWLHQRKLSSIRIQRSLRERQTRKAKEKYEAMRADQLRELLQQHAAKLIQRRFRDYRRYLFEQRELKRIEAKKKKER